MKFQWYITLKLPADFHNRRAGVNAGECLNIAANKALGTTVQTYLINPTPLVGRLDRTL